ncbi:MAG: sigma 54-interacting transcriptional regulator, partial [Prevotella sp.]|nr:sigma 54-interacting transcriptional regulator [Prevotella sp.]
MKHHILIVEDDLTFATMLKSYLGKKGYLVDSASKVSMACSQIEKGNFDLVLTDLRLPDKDGTVLLPWMREKGLHTPVIIMTRYADIRGAVQAMKDGAADYIAKPMHPDELLKKIQDAIGENALDQVPAEQNYKDLAANNTYLEGESEEARRLYNYVALVAPTSMSVLITGASGTGKEFVAHRIHEKSNRSDKPFFAIDCGAIPEELAASEFFGHIKGSFTGALTDKVGAFEAAHGGTLFLDEVENLSYKVQVQLLRAIQE